MHCDKRELAWPLTELSRAGISDVKHTPSGPGMIRYFSAHPRRNRSIGASILCERGADRRYEVVVLSGLERGAGEVAIRVERVHDFPDRQGYFALSFDEDVTNQPYRSYRHRSVLLKRDDVRSDVGRGKGDAVGRVAEGLLQREGVDLDSGITVRVKEDVNGEETFDVLDDCEAAVVERVSEVDRYLQYDWFCRCG